MNASDEMEQFDEIKWLNSYVTNSSPLNPKEIQRVLSFCLMWNLFERVVCNKSANANRITQYVESNYSEKEFNIKDYEHFLNYFKNRYVSSGTTNRAFSALNFRSNDKVEIVEEVLKGNDITGKGIIKALLLMVLRLRNNLFHGMKETCELKFQEGNFNVANQIIAKYLETLEKLNKIKLSVEYE